MKSKYLQEIESLLRQYQIQESEIKDIISDYDQMYEDGLAKTMTDQEIRDFLGDPERIVLELCENYERKQVRNKGHKLIALMPFIALIAFFILGHYFDLWHPGWLVFLLVPITALIVEMLTKKKRDILIALSPFLAIVIFLVIGITAGVWHPTWLVFLIIPVSAIIIGSKDRSIYKMVVALSPFVALTVFFILGELGIWHPTWLVFMIVPMVGVLNKRPLWKCLVYELAILCSIGLYLILGYVKGVWGMSLFVFLLPVAFAVLLDGIVIKVTGKSLEILAVIIFAIAVYLLGGFFAGAWAYLWLVFLLIPVYSIIRFSHRKDILVALSPFIAITVFFLLGYFANLWTIAWLAFLLIPITAILKSKN